MNRSPLKWAGSKYSILPHILDNIDIHNDFVDVFSGGGSVWLNVDSPMIVANDINPDLINCFTQIKTNIEPLIDELETIFLMHTKEQYWALRDEFNVTKNKIWSAALFIYLNKYCYGGTMRYNNKGEFNQAYGNKPAPLSPPIHEIIECHIKMHDNKVKLECRDYATCIADHDSPNTFFYIDPPYVPVTATSFIKYYDTAVDHTALADLCHQIRGNFLLSNSDTPLTRKLYKDFYMVPIEVNRGLCTKTGGSIADELLISNTSIILEFEQ